MSRPIYGIILERKPEVRLTCTKLIEIFGPAHDILVLIANSQKSLLNNHAVVYGWTRGLNFGLSLHYIHTLCMCSAKALKSLSLCMHAAKD